MWKTPLGTNSRLAVRLWFDRQQGNRRRLMSTFLSLHHEEILGQLSMFDPNPRLRRGHGRESGRHPSGGSTARVSVAAPAVSRGHVGRAKAERGEEVPPGRQRRGSYPQRAPSSPGGMNSRRSSCERKGQEAIRRGPEAEPRWPEWAVGRPPRRPGCARWSEGWHTASSP